MGMLKVIKMAAMFILVIALLSLFGGLTPIINSPMVSETSEFSENAENVSDVPSDARSYINTNGSIEGVSGQKIRISYSNESMGTVETRLLGVELVSNDIPAGTFNASGECYSSVVSDFDQYTEAKLVGSNVRVIPVKFNGSTVYVSQVVFLDTGDFVGAGLVSNGYAVVDSKNSFSENTRKEMVKIQESAQENEKGVWGCVPESAE